MWQTMTFIYEIIIFLATVALAKGSTKCLFSEGKEGHHYFAVEGQTLCFSLANTSPEVTLKKDGKHLIFKVKNQMVYLKGVHAESQSQVPKLPNINLGKATKNDSGIYTLEEFLSNGTLLKTITIHLKVQAPVSTPEVSQLCLSPEESVAYCSAEGDGLEFIWSLDNNTLTQTRAERSDKPTSKVSNATISLHGQLTGNLACIIHNNISREHTVIHLRSCKGSTCHPASVTATVAVISSASTLLLLLAPFLCMKHFCKNPRPVTVNEDDAENEIVYSDVRVKPARERRPNTKQ